MRTVVLIILIVFISCQSKKTLSLGEMQDADWKELEPGIAYIEMGGDDIETSDSVEFKLVGASSLMVMKPTKEDPQMTQTFRQVFAVLKPKIIGKEGGYIKIDFNKLVSMNMRQFEMIAYVTQEPDSASLGKNLEWLRYIPGVKSAEYISKEAAAKTFNAENPAIDWNKVLTDNPFPASYNIQLTKDSSTQTFMKMLSDSIRIKITNIEDVSYTQPLLEKSGKDYTVYVEYRKR